MSMKQIPGTRFWMGFDKVNQNNVEFWNVWSETDELQISEPEGIGIWHRLKEFKSAFKWATQPNNIPYLYIAYVTDHDEEPTKKRPTENTNVMVVMLVLATNGPVSTPLAMYHTKAYKANQYNKDNPGIIAGHLINDTIQLLTSMCPNNIALVTRPTKFMIEALDSNSIRYNYISEREKDYTIRTLNQEIYDRDHFTGDEDLTPEEELSNAAEEQKMKMILGYIARSNRILDDTDTKHWRLTVPNQNIVTFKKPYWYDEIQELQFPSNKEQRKYPLKTHLYTILFPQTNTLKSSDADLWTAIHKLTIMAEQMI